MVMMDDTKEEPAAPEAEAPAEGGEHGEHGAEGAPKKSKKKKMIILIAIVVLVLGGVGAGLFFTGIIGGHKKSRGRSGASERPTAGGADRVFRPR